MTPQFLPPNDSPPTPDEELDALEALDLQAEPDVVVSDDPPPPIGRSWAFDFTTNRFTVAPGGGGPLETRGDSTLAYWVEKALHTARGAHPIYTDYGMEEPFAEIGFHFDGSAAELESRIHDALTFHPRIEDVTDFYVSQDPNDETLAVSFTVVKDDGSTIDLLDLRL